MKRFILMAFAIAMTGIVSLGCTAKAGEQEVERMCKQLMELRGVSKNADLDPAEEMTKCKTDKMITDVSAETAACRISAKDVDTFWNKCR